MSITTTTTKILFDFEQGSKFLSEEPDYPLTKIKSIESVPRKSNEINNKKSSELINKTSSETIVEEPEPGDFLSTKKKRRWFLFQKMCYILLMNAIIPIVLYYILKSYIPAVWALVISTTPTMVSVLVQAIFLKRLDSIGVAVLFGFVLSVILAVLNGDPKLLLLRESFITASIGVVCLVTLIPIQIGSFRLKPISYYFAKDFISFEQKIILVDTNVEMDKMAFYWEYSKTCRYHFRLLTFIHVIILELEFGLKLFYIFKFDIDTVVVLSNSTLSVIGILVSVLTVLYIIRIKKQLKMEEPNMLIHANAVIKTI